MRRVIAPIAAALLVLAVAGPVAADPIGKSQFPNEYKIVCDGVVTYQNAHGIPGWDLTWAPRDTPWLLMGYTMTLATGESFTSSLPPGLDPERKDLVGPCEITTPTRTWVITEAYFLHK